MLYGRCEGFGWRLDEVEGSDRLVVNGVFMEVMNVRGCKNVDIM